MYSNLLHKPIIWDLAKSLLNIMEIEFCSVPLSTLCHLNLWDMNSYEQIYTDYL